MEKYTVEWREIEIASFNIEVISDSETGAVEVVQKLIEDDKIDEHPDLKIDISTETAFDDVVKTSN